MQIYLKVERLHLKNGQILENCDTCLLDNGFLVAQTQETAEAENNKPTKPTWYNVDTIEKLEGVEREKNAARQRIIFMG